MTVKTLLIEYDDTHGDGMGGYTLHAPAVEVVRCRDCCNAAPFYEDEQERQICWLRTAGYVVEPDDFCSYGKRGDG